MSSLENTPRWYEPVLRVIKDWRVITGIAVLYSIILHEIAHAYVADVLGDPTARDMGRITLNPLPHIHPVYSVGIPIVTGLLSYALFRTPIIFGAANPVIVNPDNLAYGEVGLGLVAGAGPATNFSIALLTHFVSRAGIQNKTLAEVLPIVRNINIQLAILNLIPFPPFDGQKVFNAILST